MALTMTKFESNPMRQIIGDAIKAKLTPVICVTKDEAEKVYTFMKEEYPTYLAVRNLDSLSVEYNSEVNGGIIFEDFGRIVGDADMDLGKASQILIPDRVPLPSPMVELIPSCPRIVIAEQSLEHILHRYLTKTYYNNIQYSILDALRVKLKQLYLNVKYLRIGELSTIEEDFSIWLLDED